MFRPAFRPAFGLMVALLVAFGAPRAASAGLVLSFDQLDYPTSFGSTVEVQVYVSQVAGGPQVGADNPLMTGGVALTFATAGPAVVLSDADVAFGPAWSFGFATLDDSGSTAVVGVTLLSFDGIADLSAPLLLATFTFHAVGLGTAPIAVAQLDPSAGSVDFITLMSDDLDPVDPALAQLAVAAPEPGALALLVAGAPAFAMFLARRRRGSVRS